MPETAPWAALADKQAIYEVILRYCRGIDRLDLELVRSCYHPGAIDHHTNFEGNRDEFVVWVEGALRLLAGTMHLVGNHLVEIDGDRARCETYCTAFHWADPATSTLENVTTGIRYVDRFERRGGRMAHRRAFCLAGVDPDRTEPAGRRPGRGADRIPGPVRPGVPPVAIGHGGSSAGPVGPQSRHRARSPRQVFRRAF